jgi:HEAT repeat protein
MAETVIRNRNLRTSVTIIQESPALEGKTKASARLKIDLMLLALHGQPERAWGRLNLEERQVLREVARQPDPAWGATHQTAAIGALAEAHDKAALLQLSEMARGRGSDLRVQVAATYAIGEIGGEQVRSVLYELLDAQAPEVRVQAAIALAKTGSAADLLHLQLLSEDDQTFVGEVAREAIDILRTRISSR